MASQSTASATIVGNKIAELESVRGIAALLVVIFHIPCWNSAIYNVHIIRNSYLMVELFFVLSGFVIYKAYAEKISNKEQLFRFQFLRFGRLYPVHIFFLLVFLAIEFGRADSFVSNSWTAFFQQLVLVQAIGPAGNSMTFNYPAWSISVEFYTYFLFGLIVLFFNRSKILIFALLGIVSLALLEIIPVSAYADLLKCTAGFFVGCMTADLSGRTNTRFRPVAVTLVFLSLLAFLQIKEDKAYDIMMYPLASLLILTLVLSDGGFIKRLLGFRILTWLGTISYSVYMCHAALLRMFDSVLKGILGRPAALISDTTTVPLTAMETLFSSIAVMALVLIVSNLTYQLIEKPFREKSRLLVLSRQNSAAANS